MKTTPMKYKQLNIKGVCDLENSTWPEIDK